MRRLWLLTTLLLLILPTGCILRGRNGARRPLFSIGDSRDEAERLTPARLRTGESASETIRETPDAARRDGAKPESTAGLSPAELMAGLESAPAAERLRFLKGLEGLGSSARKPIEARRDELLALAAVYARLLERRAGSPPEAPAVTLDREALVLLRRRYKWATDRYLAGDYLGSLRVADALLALIPESPLTPALRRLRQSSRERLLRETVLYTDLVAPDLMATPRDLTVRLKLRNRTDDPIAIIPAEGENFPVLGLLEVSYEELFPSGVVSRNRSTVKIIEAKTIALKPGEEVSLEVQIPPIHRELKRGALGRYRIEGYLRPFQLDRGEETLPYLVPIFPTEVHVVDLRDFAMVRDPLASFKDCVESLDELLEFLDKAERMKRFRGTKKPRLDDLVRRLFLSAVLAGSVKREETIAYAESIFAKLPDKTAGVVGSALSRILGEPFQFTRQEWQEWFRARKEDSSVRPGQGVTRLLGAGPVTPAEASKALPEPPR